MTGGNGAIFWLIVSVVLFIIEGLTVQLLCIWFATGALAALASAALGAPLWVQLLVFLLTSLAVLAIGRPLAKRLIKRDIVPTNAEMVVGQIGIVQEEIDNLRQTGRVSANGLDWTARTSSSDLVIPKGTQVRAVRIDGVKLIVEPLAEAVIGEK